MAAMRDNICRKYLRISEYFFSEWINYKSKSLRPRYNAAYEVDKPDIKNNDFLLKANVTIIIYYIKVENTMYFEVFIKCQ